MNNCIFVFLKNKILTLETILPVLFEIKENRNIIFVSDNMGQYKSFKSNYFINTSINKLGNLKYTGHANNKILDKIKKLLFLINIIFNILFLRKNIKIIHFGNLNHLIYKLLFKINNSNTIYSEPASSGLKSLSRINNPLYIKKTKYHSIGKTLILYNHFESKNIVSLKKRYPHLRNDFKNKKTILYLNNVHNYEKWQKFLDIQFEEIKKNNVYLHKPYVVFFVSPFDVNFFLNSNKSTYQLFEKTLKVLSRHKKINILIKLKDKAYDKTVTNIIKSNSFDVKITNLHPSLLAKNAKLFICNTPSNVFFIGKLNKIPTIEYSDYNKNFLKINNNTSPYIQYIDFFINNDEEKLINTISLCLNKPYQNVIYENLKKDYLKI